MPYTDAGKKLMLEAIEPDHISLHTDDPGQTGEHEVEGGEYARAEIDWDAVDEGVLDDSTDGIAVPVPAGTTVAAIGYWKEDAFVAFDLIPEEERETFTNAGEFEVTDAKLNANS